MHPVVKVSFSNGERYRSRADCEYGGRGRGEGGWAAISTLYACQNVDNF